MPAPVSREYRVYLALWRKAYKTPDQEVIIRCPDRRTAIAMRQGMYRAIKPFRHGETSFIDEDLVKSADKFVVYLNEETTPPQLELRERKSLAALEGIWDELGIDESDLLIGEERRLMENFSKLVEEEAPAVPTSATPFYSR